MTNCDSSNHLSPCDLRQVPPSPSISLECKQLLVPGRVHSRQGLSPCSGAPSRGKPHSYHQPRPDHTRPSLLDQGTQEYGHPDGHAGGHGDACGAAGLSGCSLPPSWYQCSRMQHCLGGTSPVPPNRASRSLGPAPPLQECSARPLEFPQLPDSSAGPPSSAACPQQAASFPSSAPASTGLHTGHPPPANKRSSCKHSPGWPPSHALSLARRRSQPH